MLPSRTLDTVAAGSPSSATGAVDAARTIDELLFRRGSWRALDATNHQVRGVRAGSLDAALGMIGHGRVATVYGQLRAGVVGVDLDLADAAPVAAEVVAWCVERDLWHVVRPSGHPGHAHVIVVAGEHHQELAAFTEQLRRVYRAGGRTIDVRDRLRPLSAPHRGGTTPPLPPRLPTLARALPKALTWLADAAQAPSGRWPTSLEPRELPTRRPRRALPQAWADYLATGTKPAQVAGWGDDTRSSVESTATWLMVTSGLVADQAWLAITQAHPQAMTKARERGRRWWVACVWNKHVEDETRKHPPNTSRRDIDPHLLARAEAVRAEFLRVWGHRYGIRRCHTLLTVLDLLLSRMVRTGQATVPCPERDLVLDCALARPVIREALHQLDTDGWIHLNRTYEPGSGEQGHQSHHASLPEPQPAGLGGEVSHIYPPSSFTPPWIQGLPHQPATAYLGPRLWHLWLALATTHGPCTVEDAARAGGWALPDTASLSERQGRTVMAGLEKLATAGLARCDAHGHWHALPLAQLADQESEAAQAAYQTRATSIGAERAAWAQVKAGTGRWHRDRQRAIRRGQVARQLGATRWWAGLSEQERTQRRSTWAARYRALSPAEQAQVKHELAERRQLAGGLTEDQLHQAWLGQLDETEYHRRAAERTRWYRSLDPEQQRQLAAGWENHRERWGIQRRPHSPATRRSAMTPTERTTALAQLDQAVLAAVDVLEQELGDLAVLGAPGRRKESA